MRQEIQTETTMVHIIRLIQDVVERIVISEMQGLELDVSCNQVSHLLRKCQNAARAPNPTNNSVFVGNVELSKQMEAVIDFSDPKKLTLRNGGLTLK
jgi:hypothetical protein